MKKIGLGLVFVLAAAALFAGDMTGGLSSDRSLVGRWRWSSMKLLTTSIEHDDTVSLSYLLTFAEDGSLKIKADCKNGTGTWRTNGNVLTLSVDSITSMNCDTGSYAEDFVDVLNEGSFEYEFTHDTGFRLKFAKGAGTADFIKTNDSL